MKLALKYFPVFSVILFLVGINLYLAKKIKSKIIPGFGSCKNCNVILISLDTLRAKSLPCYGNEKNTSPFLCDLAKKSQFFNNSYSQSAYTLDSHFSIFTSTYPSVHKMTVPFVSVLNKDIKTIPEILKENGYFNLYVGILDDPNLPLERGLGRGFDKFQDTETEKWKNIMYSINDKNKFFAFFHTYYVHIPYLPKKENFVRFYDKPVSYFTSREELCIKIITALGKKYPERLKEIDPNNRNSMNCQLLNKYIQKFTVINAQEHQGFFQLRSDKYLETFNQLDQPLKEQYMKTLYEAEIYELDQQLKDFFDYLKQRDLLNNTIIIITSDHGESFFEHNTWKHSTNLYQEVIRVPLIVYVPNTKGKVINKLVQGMDIFPTILHLLGIRDKNLDRQITGINLFSDKEHEYIVNQHFANKKQALTGKEWKFILNNDNADGKVTKELYNLVKDPEEKENLADSNRQKADDLEKKMREILSNQPVYEQKTEPFPSWINEEQRKKLIETGYF